ncbi:DUF3306 domain-containing protein [Polynucleobacter antarcticus]|uniref:DUF3306 domain-containing protein n=1 Tax=Polynucleobacter antarcticus TaxID=1743162 RepID=A0A6M9PIZ4_9BURK|nr:DUF3306 domain-containing protein [Polynucleobacter antarcticus]QKM62880.1 DUF3306 domain-containing protein [Polynucleobacter antarcticus]
MADGFLNRWSRRKAGEQIEPDKKSVDTTKQDLAINNDAIANAPQQEELPPVITLDDVEKIDRFAPDFSAFIQPGVDPAVQQAAMKKMFSDPHFNIMDGLDIYIGDYSKPDPIPLEMLKRMVQSDMLNIFRKDDEVDQDAKKLPETANADAVPSTEAAVLIEDQHLPPVQETDLTSEELTPDSGLDSITTVPVDKKTT